MKRITRIFCLVLALLLALTAPALAYEELSKGSKGDAVVELQNKLNELGYSVGTADGVWGNKTNKAVTLFQRLNGLSETAIADQQTQEVLYSGKAVYNLEALPGSSIADLLDDQIDQIPSFETAERDYTYKQFDSIEEYMEFFGISDPANPTISSWNVYIGIPDEGSETSHVYIFDELNFVDISGPLKGKSDKALKILKWQRSLVSQLQSLISEHSFMNIRARNGESMDNINSASGLSTYIKNLDSNLNMIEAINELGEIFK